MVLKPLMQALSLFCYFQNVEDGEEEDLLNRIACHRGMQLITLDKPEYIQYLMFFLCVD